MDDRAALVIENCVILILARERKTSFAALAGAMIVRRSEISAARPLQEIDAERRDMSDLRTCGSFNGVGKRSVAFTDGRVLGDLRERHHRSDTKRAFYGVCALSIFRLDFPARGLRLYPLAKGPADSGRSAARRSAW